MYEIFLENRDQRDLRRLEDQTFRRIIGQSGHWATFPGRKAVAKLPDLIAIGEYESAIIVPSTKSTINLQSSELYISDTGAMPIADS